MAHQLLNTLGHFGSGFVCKRNGKNGIRRDSLFLDQPCDAACDHARFARTGSSQDEQWALRGFDGSALFWIEFSD